MSAGPGRPHADRRERFPERGRAWPSAVSSYPLPIVHGRVDAYRSPDLAAAMHAGAAGEKEIVWLDANEHVDLYDREPRVTEAVDSTAGFLHKRLTPG